MPRRSLGIDVKKQVLHEAGYKCANPVCRTILTQDIHHLAPVSDGGPDSPDNLVALCPNCHSLHHKGMIPRESLRAWKMMLVALNEAYDRKSINVLLALDSMGKLYVQGDALVDCAGLIASSLIVVGEPYRRTYDIQLTDRGRQLITAWKSGKQDEAVAAFAVAPVQQPLGGE